MPDSGDAMNLHEAFQHLQVGDIFHGTYPARDGRAGSAICLVTGTDATTVTARTVTTYLRILFDRATLTGRFNDGDSLCTVTSTRKLPDDIHSIMLEIDRKYDPSNYVKNMKFTRVQRVALLFIATYDEMSDR